MKMKKDIQKLVDETLDSLDGIRPAGPKPFLYTRVIGRLQREQKTVWESMGSFLSRPLVVAAGLCVILIMNGFILFRSDSTSTGTKPPNYANEMLGSDNEAVLATSSSFDYENIDQQ
jgi:hypothetical protein